jgi:hypothetical protein
MTAIKKKQKGRGEWPAPFSITAQAGPKAGAFYRAAAETWPGKC